MFLGCYLAEAGYAAVAYNGVHSGESFRTSEFEFAVKEVEDAIAFARARGFKNIFLAGHSLGTRSSSIIKETIPVLWLKP